MSIHYRPYFAPTPLTASRGSLPPLQFSQGHQAATIKKLRVVEDPAKGLDMYQGGVANCSTVALLYGLSRHPEGARILNNMIDCLPNGQYQVTFPRYPRHPILVTQEELQSDVDHLVEAYRPILTQQPNLPFFLEEEPVNNTLEKLKIFLLHNYIPGHIEGNTGARILEIAFCKLLHERYPSIQKPKKSASSPDAMFSYFDYYLNDPSMSAIKPLIKKFMSLMDSPKTQRTLPSKSIGDTFNSGQFAKVSFLREFFGFPGWQFDAVSLNEDTLRKPKYRDCPIRVVCTPEKSENLFRLRLDRGATIYPEHAYYLETVDFNQRQVLLRSPHHFKSGLLLGFDDFFKWFNSLIYLEPPLEPLRTRKA